MVLYLGRLNFKKGLDLLTQAFGDLARRRPDVHLVLAGPDDDGYGERVRGWLGEVGALERCTIVGMQVGAAKLAALHGADVFVLPSYSENFGVSVVEAMASGLPVVSTNVSGLPECVEHGVTGLLVPERQPEALAAAIGLLLSDPERARALGRAGRAKVEREFAAHRNVRPIATALYEALAVSHATAEVSHAVGG